MANITHCYRCGGLYFTRLESCPHCGNSVLAYLEERDLLALQQRVEDGIIASMGKEKTAIR